MSDFCYSWPMLKRVHDQAELMDRVMEAIGLAPARAARIDRGMAFYEARTRCIECVRDGPCRDWLAGLPAGKAPHPPAFCCNAAFFDRAKKTTSYTEVEDRRELRPADLEGALATRDLHPRDRERE